MPSISDIKVGDALPGFSRKPSAVDLFLYNAAIWNAHRIHFDQAHARSEGHPAVVIDGPLQADWLTQIVVEWMGEDGSLLSFKYSNRKAAFLGETLSAGGRVEAVDAQTGEVTLDLEVRNEAGETITPARAVAKFRDATTLKGSKSTARGETPGKGGARESPSPC